MSGVEIRGHCDAAWTPLRDAFEEGFTAGEEIGASLCVMQGERSLLELWAGDRWPRGYGPWERDTLVLVYSTSKLPLVLCVLLLIERGALELDAPVARYWPEFAAGGKQAVTVREAMTHRAGVPGLAQPAPYKLQFDWHALAARVAAEPHWFEGEARGCYHPVLFGVLLGELIRRVDGRMPDVFLREEITLPLAADFSYGLPEGLRARATDLYVPHPLVFEAGTLAERVFASFSAPDPQSHEAFLLDAISPAVNGWSNARGIARLGSILANRGIVDGRHWLSTDLIDEVTKPQWQGTDPLMGPIVYGLGLALDHEAFPAPVPTAMHWGGFGGSIAVMDPASGIAMGYAMNNCMIPEEIGEADDFEFDARGERIRAALGACIRALAS